MTRLGDVTPTGCTTDPASWLTSDDSLIVSRQLHQVRLSQMRKWCLSEARGMREVGNTVCGGTPDRVRQHAQACCCTYFGRVSIRFGEELKYLNHRRIKGGLGPCARKLKSRTERFLERNPVPNCGDFSLRVSEQTWSGERAMFLGWFKGNSVHRRGGY